MKKRFIFLILFPVLLLTSQEEAAKPWKEIPPAEKDALISYLKVNWKSPEDYVIEKVGDYELVFIGEYHRIKHDVELIHNLIPRLYAAGVRNLAIEFGCYEDQEQVDKLITSDNYDEESARRLMFNFASFWGYVEYIDIYRKAWELNHSLPAEKPKFRIIHLNYRPDWNAVEEKMTPELWRKVWHKGDVDEHMAKVILNEIISQNEKALIYSGSHHAFTRYQMPIYDFEKKAVIGLSANRMGNILQQKFPEKVFNIFLHSPWPTKESFHRHNYPLGGVIDLIMNEFKEKRVGFDAIRSPFGQLEDADTYYSIGYERFTLSNFCDGYIFQKHFQDYEGCTVEEKFITAENWLDAVARIPNFQARKLITGPEMFILAMKEDADIKRRFRDLK